jgi:ABC-type enterobactin transport system permease subunit
VLDTRRPQATLEIVPVRILALAVAVALVGGAAACAGHPIDTIALADPGESDAADPGGWAVPAVRISLVAPAGRLIPAELPTVAALMPRDHVENPFRPPRG